MDIELLRREVRILRAVVFLALGFGASLLLVAARAVTRKATFDEITVHRISVVEPNGTLRMVISDRSLFPGGRERPYAGMLFYNDEGTENGGLIFGGHKNARGEVVDSGVSLSFDRYGAPQQIVQLAGVDDVHDKFSGLAVNGFSDSGLHHRRVWVGRDASEASSVALMDGEGRKRIVMQVMKDGTAALTFLGEDGKVVKQITP